LRERLGGLARAIEFRLRDFSEVLRIRGSSRREEVLFELAFS